MARSKSEPSFRNQVSEHLGEDKNSVLLYFHPFSNLAWPAHSVKHNGLVASHCNSALREKHSGWYVCMSNQIQSLWAELNKECIFSVRKSDG